MPLKVEHSASPWTQHYQTGEVITLPIAHGEGSYYADAGTLKSLEDNHQVLFRYCNAEGKSDQSSNPNGSLNHIAGICNRKGNVLGMMPHPERASDPSLGGTDGRRLFEGMLGAIAAI